MLLAWVVVAFFAGTALYFTIGVKLHEQGKGLWRLATPDQVRVYRRFMIGNWIGAAIAVVVAVILSFIV